MIEDWPVLVMDASSPRVQVGVLGGGGVWLSFFQSESEVLDSLFGGVSRCLTGASVALGDLGGFVFCGGPGSTLGIRVAAMAVTGWLGLEGVGRRPVFNYSSLALAAAFLRADSEAGVSGEGCGGGPSLGEVAFPCRIVAGVRAGLWSCLWTDSEGRPGPVGTITSEALAGGEGEEEGGERCWYFSQRKVWPGLPPGARPLPYRLEDHPGALVAPGLLVRSDRPEVTIPAKTDYREWEGRRHGGGG